MKYLLAQYSPFSDLRITEIHHFFKAKLKKKLIIYLFTVQQLIDNHKIVPNAFLLNVLKIFRENSDEFV